jgi:hypothetical protein
MEVNVCDCKKCNNNSKDNVVLRIDKKTLSKIKEDSVLANYFEDTFIDICDSCMSFINEEESFSTDNYFVIRNGKAKIINFSVIGKE